jgi:hypothetical protein
MKFSIFMMPLHYPTENPSGRSRQSEKGDCRRVKCVSAREEESL